MRLRKVMGLRIDAAWYEKPVSGWYGLAYFDVVRQCNVFYLFGLHWIVRWLRRAWEWSVWCRPSKLEMLLQEACERARQEGLECGRDQGRREIREEVHAALRSFVVEQQGGR